jgi:hypothetical protein
MKNIYSFFSLLVHCLPQSRIYASQEHSHICFIHHYVLNSAWH